MTPTMLARLYDKSLLAAALLVLGLVAAWFLLARGEVSAVRGRAVSLQLGAADYEAPAVTVPAVTTERWRDAAASTASGGWVFDVFTPPVIYYNRASGQFSITAPVEEKAPEAVAPLAVPFGVELVEVRRDVFRLQLVGYVGDESNYLGVFENTISGETMLARAGRRFPALGLTVRRFDVRRERVELPDSMPVTQTVATAEVRDERTGETVILNTLGRHITGAPTAVLRVVATGERREEKAGATFVAGAGSFTVSAVSAEPPSATVVKRISTDAEPEERALTPHPGDAPVAAVSDETLAPLGPSTPADRPFPPF